MSPAALNAFHNLYLKQVAGRDLTLTVINHPLPRNATSKVHRLPLGTAIIMTDMYLVMRAG